MNQSVVDLDVILLWQIYELDFSPILFVQKRYRSTWVQRMEGMNQNRVIQGLNIDICIMGMYVWGIIYLTTVGMGFEMKKFSLTFGPFHIRPIDSPIFDSNDDLLDLLA